MRGVRGANIDFRRCSGYSGAVGRSASAVIGRKLFLVCRGIILPLILFGNTTPCFVSLLKVIVSLFIGFLVIQVRA